MTVVCSIPLPGECDGDAMKATLNAFSALPQVIWPTSYNHLDVCQLMLSAYSLCPVMQSQ